MLHLELGHGSDELCEGQRDVAGHLQNRRTDAGVEAHAGSAGEFHSAWDNGHGWSVARMNWGMGLSHLVGVMVMVMVMAMVLVMEVVIAVAMAMVMAMVMVMMMMIWVEGRR